MRRGWIAGVVMALLLPLTATAGEGRRFNFNYDGTFSVPVIVDLDPLTAYLESYVAGRATGVGRYEGTYAHYLNYVDGTFQGEFVMRTKRGDIHIALSGFAVPLSETDIELHFVGTVTGGTGRYVGATGSVTGLGQASLAALQVSAKFEGRLKRARHHHDDRCDDDRDDDE